MLKEDQILNGATLHVADPGSYTAYTYNMSADAVAT